MLYKDAEFSYVLEEYPAFISVAVMAYPVNSNFGEVECVQLAFSDYGPRCRKVEAGT